MPTPKSERNALNTQQGQRKTKNFKKENENVKTEVEDFEKYKKYHPFFIILL